MRTAQKGKLARGAAAGRGYRRAIFQGQFSRARGREEAVGRLHYWPYLRRLCDGSARALRGARPCASAVDQRWLYL